MTNFRILIAVIQKYTTIINNGFTGQEYLIFLFHSCPVARMLPERNFFLAFRQAVVLGHLFFVFVLKIIVY